MSTVITGAGRQKSFGNQHPSVAAQGPEQAACNDQTVRGVGSGVHISV